MNAISDSSTVTETFRPAGNRGQRTLHDAERAVARIPEVEAAIQRRSDWIHGHPAELAWEADLRARLDGRDDVEQVVADRDQRADHDLDAIIGSIDLRTIDLSPGPRTGIERAIADALGLPQNRGAAGIPPPSLPDHCLDAGPDLGF